MSFKYISYLELWRPLCSAELNHLCNFGREHHKEQSVIFLNMDLTVFQEMSFKEISYLEYALFLALPSLSFSKGPLILSSISFTRRVFALFSSVSLLHGRKAAR